MQSVIKQKQHLLREKYEEICLVLEEILFIENDILGQILTSSYTGKVPVIEKTNTPIRRLTMLIQFYAPQFNEFLELLIESLQICSLSSTRYLANAVSEFPKPISQESPILSEILEAHGITKKI